MCPADRSSGCVSPRPAEKAKILILDDSTSAVDTKTDALIRRAFQERDPGTTKFIIAQRVSSVEEADHIPHPGGRPDRRLRHHTESWWPPAPIYRRLRFQNQRGNEDA
jgi:ATP-binding cassette subfamily B protein